MEIKVIAMDMDGTLLRSDNTISDYTKKVLLDVQKQGIQLVLASGRSYRKLLSYAKELQMDTFGGYLIEVNGVALYDVATNKREVYHQLEHAQLQEIFNEVKGYGAEIIGLSDDGMYDYIPEDMMEEKRLYRKEHQLSDDYPWTAGTFTFISDNRIGYPNQHTIKDASDLPKSLNKMIVAHHPHVMKVIASKIKELLSDRYWLGLTAPGWLEIMPKGVTKGSGILNLSKQLHIPLSNMMAFGDGENDIEMLESVGYGVAMENALPNILDIAQDTCPSNNEDGVAQKIESMILSK